MSVLVAIALKSLLVAGVTIGLLMLMKHRSAAERSWVAHIGLLALLVMAFAPLALPRWTVETTVLRAESLPVEAASRVTESAPAISPKTSPFGSPHAVVRPKISAAAVASAVYAIPAVILLLITALALARLVALRARAEVLVDGHWLSALAR